MGGKAFSQVLPNATFPRLSHAAYHTLKVRLLPSVQALYTHVQVPIEAPEKADHGDIDFVVFSAHPVNRGDVKNALGAVGMVESEMTSSYAIPLDELGGEAESLQSDTQSESSHSHSLCQVDVHVCEDVDDWERVVFFHAYGDLGMIVSQMASFYGISLGVKGLLVPFPTAPIAALKLASRPCDMIPFWGLSMATWEAGFANQIAAFEWVASSPYFDSSKFVRTPKKTGDVQEPEKSKNSRQRKLETRGMYSAFLEWASTRTPQARKITSEEVVDAALAHFGKADTYVDILTAYERRRRAKAMWSGSIVRGWLEEGLISQDGKTVDWRHVKAVMDRVKRGLPGGDIDAVVDLDEAGLQRRVLTEWRALCDDSEA